MKQENELNSPVIIKSGRAQYDEEQLQYVRDNYLKVSLRKLAEEMGIGRGKLRGMMKLLGLVLPPEVKRERANQFKKGLVPWNKGKAIPFVRNSSNFVKGHVPVNKCEDGEVRWRKHTNAAEYYVIRVAGKWVMWQRYLWEQAHGKIPAGHVVIFLDGNSRNCVLENLACISRAEHAKRNKANGGPRKFGTDKFYAKKVFGSHWKRGLKKHPELVELKKLEYTMNNLIREVKNAG